MATAKTKVGVGLFTYPFACRRLSPSFSTLIFFSHGVMTLFLLHEVYNNRYGLGRVASINHITDRKSVV